MLWARQIRCEWSSCDVTEIWIWISYINNHVFNHTLDMVLCMILLILNKNFASDSENDSNAMRSQYVVTLLWRHNYHNGVSNHQPRDCLLNLLFKRRSKKTSKLRVTGLCVGNSPITGEFPAQRASNAENVSIWWRHDSNKHTSMIALLFSIIILWSGCLFRIVSVNTWIKSIPKCGLVVLFVNLIL